MRQKFHDIRSRRSIGGALGIGPRLGSQPLVLVVAIAMALIRSGSDRGTDGTTVGGVGVDADWRAHSTALHTQANCGQQLLCWEGAADSAGERIRLRGLVCRLGFRRKMSLDIFQCARCFGEATAGLECVPSAFHLFQNVAGFGCPNVGLGLAVVCGDVVLDGLLEFPNIVKDAAAYAFVGEVSEEPFYLVEPGGTGGSEMQVEARMLLEPRPYLGGLMRRVVVQDQVDVFGIRCLLVDQL